MKKLLNDPVDFVDEMLDGLCAAHPAFYRRTEPGARVIVRADAPVSGKVGIVSGGGSGHLPIFTGYVGPGLLDGCAIGEVFSSPSVDQITEAMRAVNGGAARSAAVRQLRRRDVMNFDMAGEFMEMEGHPVDHRAAGRRRGQRPTGGKGKAAWRRGHGLRLQDRRRQGRRNGRPGRGHPRRPEDGRFLPVRRRRPDARAPCRLAGKPTFEIGENEMEMGMGIHGESGVWRGPPEAGRRCRRRDDGQAARGHAPGRRGPDLDPGQQPRRDPRRKSFTSCTAMRRNAWPT